MTLSLTTAKHDILPQLQNRKRQRKAEELQTKRQMQRCEQQLQQYELERQRWADERRQLLEEVQEHTVLVPEPEPVSKNFPAQNACP